MGEGGVKDEKGDGGYSYKYFVKSNIFVTVCVGRDLIIKFYIM